MVSNVGKSAPQSKTQYVHYRLIASYFLFILKKSCRNEQTINYFSYFKSVFTISACLNTTFSMGLEYSEIPRLIKYLLCFINAHTAFLLCTVEVCFVNMKTSALKWMCFTSKSRNNFFLFDLIIKFVVVVYFYVNEDYLVPLLN